MMLAQMIRKVRIDIGSGNRMKYRTAVNPIQPPSKNEKIFFILHLNLLEKHRIDEDGYYPHANSR